MHDDDSIAEPASATEPAPASASKACGGRFRDECIKKTWAGLRTRNIIARLYGAALVKRRPANARNAAFKAFQDAVHSDAVNAAILPGINGVEASVMGAIEDGASAGTSQLFLKAKNDWRIVAKVLIPVIQSVAVAQKENGELQATLPTKASGPRSTGCTMPMPHNHRLEARFAAVGANDEGAGSHEIMDTNHATPSDADVAVRASSSSSSSSSAVLARADVTSDSDALPSELEGVVCWMPSGNSGLPADARRLKRQAIARLEEYGLTPPEVLAPDRQAVAEQNLQLLKGAWQTAQQLPSHSHLWIDDHVLARYTLTRPQLGLMMPWCGRSLPKRTRTKTGAVSAVPPRAPEAEKEARTEEYQPLKALLDRLYQREKKPAVDHTAATQAAVDLVAALQDHAWNLVGVWGRVLLHECGSDRSAAAKVLAEALAACEATKHCARASIVFLPNPACPSIGFDANTPDLAKAALEAK